MSDANYASIGFILATTWGEVPATPRLTALRFTAESLLHEKETIESQEVRDDRQVADLVEVGQQAAGGFEFELSFGAHDAFLRAALFSGAGTVIAIAAVAADIVVATQLLDGAPGDFDDVPVGASVKIAGATNPANNGIKLVTAKAVDGSTLTFAAGSFVADEPAAILTLSGTHLRNGVVAEDYVLERRVKRKNGTDFFQHYLGMMADGLTLNFESKQIVTGEVTFVGKRGGDPSDDSLDSVVTGTRASRVLTTTGNFAADETVTIGSTVYTFKAPAAAPFEVLVGVDEATSLANLAAAVNRTTGEGVAYGTGTTAHPTVTATPAATTLTATAIEPGTAGNAIATTEVAANAAWAGATLTGGVAAGGYDPSPTNPVMNATTNVGTFLFNQGASAECLKSLSLTIANGLRGKDCMGELGNFDVGVGTFSLTGSLAAYLLSNELYAAFRNHEDIALSWRVTDAAGNTYVFTIPRLKLNTAEPFVEGRNTDIMLNSDFTALLDPVTGCTFIVDVHAA